jgi:hypothetical protein
MPTEREGNFPGGDLSPRHNPKATQLALRPLIEGARSLRWSLADHSATSSPSARSRPGGGWPPTPGKPAGCHRRAISFCSSGGTSIPAKLPRRVQITLKPSAKGLRMHRIFIGGKGCKCVIADSALELVQVHAGAFWLDADEHHRSFAPRTRGALKSNRKNGGQWALRLGHDHSLRT